MKIIFLGDIALMGRASMSDNDQWETYFSDIENLLSNYDYVVGNLETPFSYRRKKHGAKSAFLYSDPKNIEILKKLHVDAVTLANNHIFDYGKEGFELTKCLLKENEIEWFGAEGKNLKVDIAGNKLVFSGWCCYSTNPQGNVSFGEYGINELDVSTIEHVLEKYNKEGWLNIAAVHTGIEHVNYPSLDTICLAKRLAKTSPLIFYGHHPHVAQPIEKVGESLIAYSLGNFCFDDIYNKKTDKIPIVELSEMNRSSFLLSVTIERNHIIKYEVIPIYIGKDKLEVGHGITKKDLDVYLDIMKSVSHEEYEAMRRLQRSEWLNQRLAKRNLKWFLKRLRPRYIRLMITNKLNVIKYKKHVHNQLSFNN